MVTLRLVPNTVLARQLAALEEDSDDQVYLAAKTVLKRIQYAKGHPVEVQFSRELAATLLASAALWPGGQIRDQLTSTLSTQEAREKRGSERRDRETVRQSRGFLF